MSLSEMSIWIRDTEHPCLPYESTGHRWIAVIVSCDLAPLSFGAVNNGFFPLTEKGKGGGEIHGQVMVPPGCYLVFAFATCKNIFTDMAMVQVGCATTVCVNLLPKRLTTCTGQLVFALDIWKHLGTQYRPNSPAGVDVPDEVLDGARDALHRLLEYLPPDPVMEKIPVGREELEKLAKEETERGV